MVVVILKGVGRFSGVVKHSVWKPQEDIWSMINKCVLKINNNDHCNPSLFCAPSFKII